MIKKEQSTRHELTENPLENWNHIPNPATTVREIKIKENKKKENKQKKESCNVSEAEKYKKDNVTYQ